MTRRTGFRSAVELERALMAAGQKVPSPDARALERTLARLERAAVAGLCASAAASSSGTAAGAVISGTAAAGKVVVALGSSTKSMTALLLGKWLVAGVAVGVAGLGAAAAVRGPELGFWHGPSHSASTGAEQNTGKAARRRAAHVVQPSTRSPEIAQAPSAVTPAAAPRQSGVPRSSERNEASSPSETDSTVPAPSLSEADSTRVPTIAARISPELAAELGLLDRARAALERGDRGEALAWLARHDREFPKGQLRPEASLLRQRAASATGASGHLDIERSMEHSGETRPLP